MARIKYWNEAKGVWDYADGGTPLETIQQATNESLDGINTAKTQAVNNVAAKGTEQVGAVKAEGDRQVARVQEAGGSGLSPEQAAQIEQNKNDIISLKDKTIGVINLYNPALQTPETISPHYYFNGEPYGSAELDKIYNCTSLIEVKENATYSIRLIPQIEAYTLPWGKAAQGVFFYDENENYLGSTATETFTTPLGTKNIRFNYYVGLEKFSLETLNSHCVFVEGEIANTQYIPYRKESLQEQINNVHSEINSINFSNYNFYYKISNEKIELRFPYSSAKTGCLELYRDGGNNLFDFRKISICENTIPYEEIQDTDKSTVIETTSDWHSPFIVKALTNIDGDNIDSNFFTGGNHQYNNYGGGSTPTASSSYVKFYVKNREITNGNGYANKILIRWENFVQGYNTTKANGDGRNILKEVHNMTFDGIKFITTTDLIALENIQFKRVYGFQGFGGNSVYNNIRFVGSNNRLIEDGKMKSIYCNDSYCEKIIATGNEHGFELGINTNVDYGRSGYYKDNARIFTAGSTGKIYCTFISENNATNLSEGEMIRIQGTYKFFSVV